MAPTGLPKFPVELCTFNPVAGLGRCDLPVIKYTYHANYTVALGNVTYAVPDQLQAIEAYTAHMVTSGFMTSGLGAARAQDTGINWTGPAAGHFAGLGSSATASLLALQARNPTRRAVGSVSYTRTVMNIEALPYFMWDLLPQFIEAIHMLSNCSYAEFPDMWSELFEYWGMAVYTSATLGGSVRVEWALDNAVLAAYGSSWAQHQAESAFMNTVGYDVPPSTAFMESANNDTYFMGGDVTDCAPGMFQHWVDSIPTYPAMVRGSTAISIVPLIATVNATAGHHATDAINNLTAIAFMTATGRMLLERYARFFAACVVPVDACAASPAACAAEPALNGSCCAGPSSAVGEAAAAAILALCEESQRNVSRALAQIDVAANTSFISAATLNEVEAVLNASGTAYGLGSTVGRCSRSYIRDQCPAGWDKLTLLGVYGCYSTTLESYDPQCTQLWHNQRLYQSCPLLCTGADTDVSYNGAAHWPSAFTTHSPTDAPPAPPGSTPPLSLTEIVVLGAAGAAAVLFVGVTAVRCRQRATRRQEHWPTVGSTQEALLRSGDVESTAPSADARHRAARQYLSLFTQTGRVCSSSAMQLLIGSGDAVPPASRDLCEYLGLRIGNRAAVIGQSRPDAVVYGVTTADGERLAVKVMTAFTPHEALQLATAELQAIDNLPVHDALLLPRVAFRPQAAAVAVAMRRGVGTLKDLVPLDIPRGVALLRQVVRGVQHLHANGVAHGDLKPTNVIVTDSETVGVADFGCATAHRSDGRVVRGGGTMRYLAPEWRAAAAAGGVVATGVTDAERCSVDTYALGATVVEVLCGNDMFAVWRAVRLPPALVAAAVGATRASPYCRAPLDTLAAALDDDLGVASVCPPYAELVAEWGAISEDDSPSDLMDRADALQGDGRDAINVAAVCLALAFEALHRHHLAAAGDAPPSWALDDDAAALLAVIERHRAVLMQSRGADGPAGLLPQLFRCVADGSCFGASDHHNSAQGVAAEFGATMRTISGSTLLLQAELEGRAGGFARLCYAVALAHVAAHECRVSGLQAHKVRDGVVASIVSMVWSQLPVLQAAGVFAHGFLRVGAALPMLSAAVSRALPSGATATVARIATAADVEATLAAGRRVVLATAWAPTTSQPFTVADVAAAVARGESGACGHAMAVVASRPTGIPNVVEWRLRDSENLRPHDTSADSDAAALHADCAARYDALRVLRVDLAAGSDGSSALQMLHGGGGAPAEMCNDADVGATTAGVVPSVDEALMQGLLEAYAVQLQVC